MLPTFVISNPLSTNADLDIKSYFTFTQSGNNMVIDYSIQNIAAGPHKLQLHDYGNIIRYIPLSIFYVALLLSLGQH